MYCKLKDKSQKKRKFIKHFDLFEKYLTLYFFFIFRCFFNEKKIIFSGNQSIFHMLTMNDCNILYHMSNKFLNQQKIA